MGFDRRFTLVLAGWVVALLVALLAAIAAFATPGLADKFAGIAGRSGVNGVPLLDGTVAQFECSAHAQYPGGDHRIFIGRIDTHRWSNRTPLMFCKGVLMPASQDDSRQAQT